MATQNPNRLSAQLSPFDNPNNTRQSPFRRQNSQSPATAASPTKGALSLSPTKLGPLSPEKTSPFVRRPSQISNASDRPSSPFARPTSSLSVVSSPTRHTSNGTQKEHTPDNSRQTPTRETAARTPPVGAETPKITSPYDGATHSVEEAPEDSPFYMTPTINMRPTVQRNVTSSTTTTVKPPVFCNPQAKAALTRAPPPRLNAMGGGAYNHVPQSLLHSMRESFEVIDSNNTGAINSAAVADMLSQMGLDNNPAALKDFFPSNGPAQLNLARYLDMLTSPLAEVSQQDELRAAFEAFDVDDSGQVDVATLRNALLHTAPQPGEDMIRLSEREVDSILQEFGGRRAFGSKGLNAGRSKGEVFKYRDFMSNINGGAASAHGAEAAMAT